MSMQLNELIITRNRYGFEHQGVRQGELGGRIAFSNPSKHEVTLNLSQEHIDKILGIIAESMVETTRELAGTLTASVIEHASTRSGLLLEAV